MGFTSFALVATLSRKRCKISTDMWNFRDSPFSASSRKTYNITQVNINRPKHLLFLVQYPTFLRRGSTLCQVFPADLVVPFGRLFKLLTVLSAHRHVSTMPYKNIVINTAIIDNAFFATSYIRFRPVLVLSVLAVCCFYCNKA